MNVQHRLFSVFGYHTLTHPLKTTPNLATHKSPYPLIRCLFSKLLGVQNYNFFPISCFFIF